MTTTTHPLVSGVLAALRAEPQTLPEIRRRLGRGAMPINKIAEALCALEDAGRAKRVKIESGGWGVYAWRLAHPGAQRQMPDPDALSCSTVSSPLSRDGRSA